MGIFVMLLYSSHRELYTVLFLIWIQKQWENRNIYGNIYVFIVNNKIMIGIIFMINIYFVTCTLWSIC